MNISLRLEEPKDYKIVENLIREAFWGYMNPGCDGEHWLACELRKADSFIPELNYVAEIDGKIVGHIIYSKAKIIDADNKEYEIINFGPLSVLPELRNNGIGTILMEHTIEKAREMGFRAIVFFGHPDYYPRFGFSRASRYNIVTSEGDSFDALMAMPLYDGALEGISGKYYEDPLFDVDQIKMQEYDKQFETKEQCILQSVDVLMEKIDDCAQNALKEHNVTTLASFFGFSGNELASWKGITIESIEIINDVLREYNYPPKIVTSNV